MDFLVGADPEVFLRTTEGSLVSAIHHVPGTKNEPVPLDIGDGFMVQHDNVALEFGIPPAADAEALINNINLAMDHISQAVLNGQFVYDTGSAYSFPPFLLMDPEARVFGCDPDFNAWEGGAINPRPHADDHNLRSAGGHVHVGVDIRSKQQGLTLVKLLDLTLGVGSILLDPQGDYRRTLYGKRGAFRPKPYGVEYRSLSNFWIFDKKHTAWVWNGVDRAIKLMEEGFDIDSENTRIFDAINNNNKNTAAALCDYYHLI
jgi:Phage phiEco32-like COOH.NH2 ligase-type 2